HRPAHPVPDRDAVPDRVVDARALHLDAVLGRAVRVGPGERAVLRDELLAHEDVVARGAAQPHRVPGVDDLVLARGALEHEEAHLRRAARAAGPLDRREQEVEVAVEGPARELPVAVEDVAAVDGHRARAPRRPARRGDARVAHRVAAAPQPFLRLRREEREDEVVHRVVLVAPGGARAAAAELDRDAHVGREGELVAAVGARLEDAEEARMLELADRLLGDAALALAALRALAQRRHQRARPPHRLAGAGTARRAAPCLRHAGLLHQSSPTAGSTPGTTGTKGATSSVRPRPPASIAAPRPAKRGSKQATGSESTKQATRIRWPTPGTSGAAFGHPAALR